MSYLDLSYPGMDEMALHEKKKIIMFIIVVLYIHVIYW